MHQHVPCVWHQFNDSIKEMSLKSRWSCLSQPEGHVKPDRNATPKLKMYIYGRRDTASPLRFGAMDITIHLIRTVKEIEFKMTTSVFGGKFEYF